MLVVLLLSLSVSTFSNGRTVASPEEVRWSRVNTPAEGVAGNWILARNSNIQHLTLASDGTLYCYARPSGTINTLFKSTDGGYYWSYTGGVQDDIVALVTIPDSANIVYYATTYGIFKSIDAGNSFSPLPPEPGGAGTNNIKITCIDVVRLSGNTIIVVGTTDTDSSQYGGVYILDESQAAPGWTDTGISGYDVCAVAFAPKFDTDRQLVAVVTDEQDTLITTRIADGGWGQDISDAVITGVASLSATVAFPDDYGAADGQNVLFVGLNTGNGSGDVYSVNRKVTPENSIATDLNIGVLYGLSNLDITGLAVSGNTSSAMMLAGAADSSQVYISTDGGGSWVRSTKRPTGQSGTGLLMAENFASNSIAYAVTSGTEGAFSFSADGGATWNQIGLIDSEISKSCIIDLAISPRYGQDNTLFMLTFDAVNTVHSLWRSLSHGERWERVFTSTLAAADSIKFVELSPQYDSGNRVVFLAGTIEGCPVIWKSTDNGQSFIYQKAPSYVDAWAVVNDTTLFIGSYDGNFGLIYRTTDSGLSFSTGVVAGSQSINSIILSPNYEQDGTILVGNTNGWVYYSSNKGDSFKPLPLDVTSPPLADLITVAFDPEFTINGTVYAASSSLNKGIYRFIINKSTEWERMDGNLPIGGTINQLAVSADGVLYAANSQPVSSAKAEGGIERSLNPSFHLNPTFETVTRGLDDGVTLSGLWLQGNQLWSIDSRNTRLITFIDSLTQPVFLISPADEAKGVGIRNVILKWESPSAATEYEWQLDYDTDFSSVPAGFEGDTGASSVRFSELEADTTYYWRVRVTKPVSSRWSAKWSFTMELGHTVIAPELLSPKAGAEGVSIRPLFQWSAIAGAKSYELMVSRDVSFDSQVIKRTGNNALPATAWQSDTGLEYSTTYYWKVRAVDSGSQSAWSAVGAFITIETPVTDQTIITPKLLSPESGVSGVSIKPLFQWYDVSGAESYELVVSTDDVFTSPVIAKTGDYALPTNVWQCDKNLDFNTTYYWKVRVVSSGKYSNWSSIGAFSTELPPEQPHAVQGQIAEVQEELLPPFPPSAPTEPSIPNWVIYSGIGLLLVAIILMSITLLLLAVKIKRTKAG